MKNIIAVIWDFDKTLVDGYMQDPIFEHYGVDPVRFWDNVNTMPERIMREQGVRVNPDTAYLNEFLREARPGGCFQGIGNSQLREFGSKLRFYRGVPDIFRKTREVVQTNEYQDFDIKVEHYIVSTGFTQVIKGSVVNDYVRSVWGCELIEAPGPDGKPVISEIGYTIDNTTKTRALFEINKGVNVDDRITVNSTMTREQRRVDFRNMIYIADGPSDVPAFSVVKGRGGSAFAIYPKGRADALSQVETLRKDGRIDMFAEADYSDDSTACMWICNKIREYADRLVAEARAAAPTGCGPHHLH